MAKKLKLRTPMPMMERSKRAIGILILALLMEQVDPLPFFKSTVAWLLYGWLIFEVAKQILHYRLETRYETVRKAEQYKRRWEDRKDKLDPMARYRMRRILIIITGTLVFGQIINLFSERCSNAVSCALLAPSLVIESAPTIFQVLIGVAFGMFQFAAMFWYLSGVGFGKIVPPGTIEVTFDDVFGQDKAKRRLVEFVDLLENDEEVVKAGGHLPKGALMTGPPGTGKTMMAKAAANRLTMPLILIPPGAFASTFVGINFLKVYRLGRWIRQQSTRHGGVLVFIDEIDSLGNRGGVEEGNAMPASWWMGESGREFWYEPRELGCTAIPTPEYDPYNVVVTGGGGGGMNMGTLEAFLSMIDGMEEPRGLSNKVLKFFGFKELPPPKTRVFYLGATNRPTAVDPALKRAGRLGVELRVDYPKYDGRLATYTGYLGKFGHELTEDQIMWLARNHYRGTGAEIEDVINEALLLTFRDLEREKKGVIQYHDMMTATLWKRWGESHGTFENERNVRGVAVHEAGHALTMYSLLGERRHIWFVSIEQRGRTGGMVVPAPQDDDWKQWHDEMLADVAVSLASRVAEQKFLGQLTNGHGGDGPAADVKAERLITNGHYGQISAYKPTGFYSDDHFYQLREQVLQEAQELAEREIEQHSDALLALADKLEKEHTVVGTDVHELFESFNVPMGRVGA